MRTPVKRKEKKFNKLDSLWLLRCSASFRLASWNIWFRSMGAVCKRYDNNERTPIEGKVSVLRNLSRKKERRWETDSTSLNPTSPIFPCISHLSTSGRQSQKTYIGVLCLLKANIRACMQGHSHIEMSAWLSISNMRCCKGMILHSCSLLGVLSPPELEPSKIVIASFKDLVTTVPVCCSYEPWAMSLDGYDRPILAKQS